MRMERKCKRCGNTEEVLAITDYMFKKGCICNLCKGEMEYVTKETDKKKLALTLQKINNMKVKD